MRKLKAILDRPHDEVMKDLRLRRRQQQHRDAVLRALVVVDASLPAADPSAQTPASPAASRDGG